MKDQKMPLDRRPSHGKDRRRTHHIVPPRPPKTEGVGRKGDLASSIVADGERYVGGRLEEADNDENERDVVVDGELAASSVEVDEDEKRAKDGRNR